MTKKKQQNEKLISFYVDSKRVLLKLPPSIKEC